MLEFRQQADTEAQIYIEDTDVPLPETLNPNTRYAFFSTVATGGKSLIKSCRDLHLRRTVCYKTLRPELLGNEIETKRLLREARISAQLQHPNTIPTYEIGRDNRGHYYFTMKLVHGYTLREILNYRERYDLDQLMDVIIQVGNALAYAHSRGVVHRDIKPDNILVGPYGETLLMDWGLAKVWHKDQAVLDKGSNDKGSNDKGSKDKDSEDKGGTEKNVANDESLVDEVEAAPGMTGEGKLQGSVMYMSPEQIDRDPGINFKSDVYSLGAVLYEALAGRTPFQGEIVHRLLQQIQNEVPKDPRAVSKTRIPKVLADLCMQCLQKDPFSRPVSAAEVVRILREDWHL